MRLTPLALAGSCWLASFAAYAQDDAARYAEQLSTLRTDVEQLSETLELEREALRTDLRAHELRVSDLEQRIRGEEMRLKELDREVERRRQVLDADGLAEQHLQPVVTDAVAMLRRRVRGGLPYRVTDRLDALDDLEQKVVEGTLDPRRAVGRVWTFIEDELRLTRENVLDRQVVPLAEGDTLVRVARLGMVALFYQTEDGRVGRAVRDGDAWSWTAIEEAADVARVSELFEALDKQVRVGWFELPWALPGVTP